MTILSDREIIELCQHQTMISPFVEKQIKQNAQGERILSHGTSSYGYDARLFSEFKIFTNTNSSIIDPKDFAFENFVTKTGDVCIIPPNGFVLGRTIEYFKIPNDVLVICIGKSTYARCGIIVNVTPLEPGWEGFVTLELSNTTPLPAKIYANEGICQFLFFKASAPCTTSYADRQGKYMKQVNITLPSV